MKLATPLRGAAEVDIVLQDDRELRARALRRLNCFPVGDGDGNLVRRDK